MGMDSRELATFLEKELRSRNWTVLKLAAEAKVPYETARRAVRGLGSISLDSTHKLLVPLGKKLEVQIPKEPDTAPTPSRKFRHERSKDP